MRSSLALATFAIASALAAGSLSAQQLTVRGGFANVNPKSDNGTVAGANASIDSDTAVVLGASFLFDDRWELAFDVGAERFAHEVTLAGLGRVVSLEHRPISLGANWHFLGAGEAFSPFVGLGYNWTTLSSVRGINALAGAPVAIDDSNGFTATLGADFRINERWFLRGEARYIDFDSEVTLAGANIGTANVDPWVLSLQAGIRF
jgi:outer membrane protein